MRKGRDIELKEYEKGWGRMEGGSGQEGQKLRWKKKR